jgi:hypothetical protein
VQESLQIESRAGVRRYLLPVTAESSRLPLQLAVAYEYVTGERRLAPEAADRRGWRGRCRQQLDAPLAEGRPAAIPRFAIALQQWSTSSRRAPARSAPDHARPEAVSAD